MGIAETTEALATTIAEVREICDNGAEKPSLLTMIVTDGTTMAAVEGGKELYWSTYKGRCADRDTCPSLSPECEAPTQSGFVNHLLFSSEKIEGENVWTPMEQGQIIGVDWRMKLELVTNDKRHLAVVGR